MMKLQVKYWVSESSVGVTDGICVRSSAMIEEMGFL